MAIFYADENFPLPTVVELRRLGHKVLTAEEAGQAGVKIPDDRVLAFAYSLGRVLLTMNRKHFRNLHRSGAPHCGIVICTHDNDFEALAARIDIKVSRTGNLARQLLNVTRPPPA